METKTYSRTDMNINRFTVSLLIVRCWIEKIYRNTIKNIARIFLNKSIRRNEHENVYSNNSFLLVKIFVVFVCLQLVVGRKWLNFLLEIHQLRWIPSDGCNISLFWKYIKNIFKDRDCTVQLYIYTYLVKT